MGYLTTGDANHATPTQNPDTRRWQMCRNKGMASFGKVLIPTLVGKVILPKRLAITSKAKAREDMLRAILLVQQLSSTAVLGLP